MSSHLKRTGTSTSSATASNGISSLVSNSDGQHEFHESITPNILLSPLNQNNRPGIPEQQMLIQSPSQLLPITMETSPTTPPNNSLPRLLKTLFGLNGLTLSLQSLSLMYIINTRVQVPLAYLPTYGAVAFLPYSLKPIYAYLCSYFYEKNVTRRHFLFPCLLIANAISVYATSMIPQGNVVLTFVLAFVRGVTDSWAELCLGLTLIHHARQGARRRRRQQQQTSPLLSLSSLYQDLASRFQSQAATARNMGSLLGSAITCLLFIKRQVLNPNDTQLSGPVADMLLTATGSLQLVGAIFALYHKNLFQMDSNTTATAAATTTTSSATNSISPSFVLVQQMDDHDDEIVLDGTSLSIHRAQQETFQVRGNNDNENNNNNNNNNRMQGFRSDNVLVDEESALNSHPSYSNQKDNNDDDDEEEEAVPNETDSLDSITSSTNNNDNYNNRTIELQEQQNTLSSRNTNLTLVVILQLVIILIGMKDPFEEWTSSQSTWRALVFTLLVSILVLAWTMYKNQWFQTSHRVGLFLILRHAIPSDSMILASFYYTLFQSSPLVLQLLSLLSKATTAVSSWSYGKVLSGFSNGNPFLYVVAGTTILSALASLCNLPLIGHASSSTTTTSLSSFYDSDMQTLFWLAALVHVVTTFFGELEFLPDVIIATTSLVGGGSNPNNDQYHREVVRQPQQQQRPPVVVTGPTFPRDGNNMNDNEEGEEMTNDDGIAVKYGTMISCIDFGDQLGSMLAGPLVVFLGINRENDFLHLDRFVVICSVLSILSLPLILLIRTK